MRRTCSASPSGSGVAQGSSPRIGPSLPPRTASVHGSWTNGHESSDERALFHRLDSLRVDDRYIDQSTERIHDDRDLTRRTADTGARRHGQDGPPGRPTADGTRSPRAGRLPFGTATVRLGRPVDLGTGAAGRAGGIHPATPTSSSRARRRPSARSPSSPSSRASTRLVLLTGRGEDEAQRAEREVQDTGAEVTIVRCAWFMQNFSEDFLLDSIRAGEVVLPADDGQLEPFVDADDIADVAVAALTEPGHAGQVYELTSPRLLSFPEAVAEIAKASGTGHHLRPGVGRGLRRRRRRARRPRRDRRVPHLPVQRGSREQRLRHRRRPAGPRPATPRLHRLRRPETAATGVWTPSARADR